MRHKKKGRKLKRETGQRKALFKTMLNSFIKYGEIETTEAKAKELRPKIEKLVTKAKTDTVTSRRILMRRLNKPMAKRLTEEIAPKYKERPGGYTRIIKLNRRKSDNSLMAKIQFI